MSRRFYLAIYYQVRSDHILSLRIADQRQDPRRLRFLAGTRERPRLLRDEAALFTPSADQALLPRFATIQLPAIAARSSTRPA